MCGLFLALIPNFLRLSMRSWSCVLVTHRLARPAERGLCSAREGVTKTIAGSLCSGCDTAGAETWSGRAGKLLLAAQRGKEASLGVQSPQREEDASGSDRFPEVQLHYPE